MDKRLLVLASGMFAVGTDSFVVAGVLHQLSDSLHVPVGFAGQMVTLYALSYALLSPVIGALAAHMPVPVGNLSRLASEAESRNVSIL
jgi:MFS transporter, DHA1 family, inner membrane transport protein